MKSFETIFFNFFCTLQILFALLHTIGSPIFRISPAPEKNYQIMFTEKKVFALMKNNQQVQSYHEIQEQKK